MLLIKNQSTLLINSGQSSPHCAGRALLWALSLFLQHCKLLDFCHFLNLQPQPASPPCSPSFPGASILLNQGCAPLQRAPVTSSLQFRCGAKTHQLKLAASDVPGVSFCQDEKAESSPFPMQAPQHSHVMQNCQEGCLLLISVYRADGFC